MALTDWSFSPRGAIRREESVPDEALARWRHHRDRFAKTGLWPVIVPPDDETALLEMAKINEEPDEIPEASEVFARRWEELRAYEEEDEFEPMDLDFDAQGLVREAKPPVEGQIAAISDAKGPLWIVLLPCREPWEAPLVLRYGGWNDCPPPEEHAAMLREWHARHGAEPLAMGHDTLELLVRPVEDPEEAKRAAIEQCAYCYDIVGQGTETVEALAGCLLGASVWSFWWD